MRRPRFVLVRGRDAWLRGDHDRTRVGDDGRLRLAAAEVTATARVSPGVFAAWQLARRAASCERCAPDACDRVVVRLYEPGGRVLDGTPSGWTEAPRPGGAPSPVPAGTFTPLSPPTSGAWGRAMGGGRDRRGRIALLDGDRVRILTDGLRVVDTIPLPAGVTGVDVAVTDAILVVAGTRGGQGVVLRAAPGAPWEELPAPALPVSAGANATTALVILRDHGVLAVEPDRVRALPLPLLEDPLHVVGTPDGFLVAEIAGPPGTRTLFWAVTLDEAGLHVGEALVARFFDGRGAVWCDGAAWHTTSAGVAQLVASKTPLATWGRAETAALDSARYGCSWHRVFVDACVPEGCAVAVWARAADEPWPDGECDPRRVPANEPPMPVAYTGGARAPTDEEGWVRLAALDRRPGHADLPFSPLAPALPSQDPRRPADRLPLETFEGLVACDRGRFLWLRIELVGSGRATPVVDAVRVTLPRPSLLDQLPRWWGSDPAVAGPLERFLALFEGVLTETDQRIESLPWLFDPRVCPEDALDWLAAFVDLVYDRRLDEAVRRQLLLDVGFLWRARGTPAGIERLTAILSRARTQVVEGFRLRRAAGSVLGTASALGVAGSVLGPGMQLGGGGGEWEDRVGASYARWERRRQDRDAGTTCPEVAPPSPVDDDPVRAFVRRTAHRFTVIVLAPHDAELDDVLNTAIEAYKPAHTVHEICWLDAGYRLGVNSLVGVASLGDVPTASPAIVGQSALGTATTLSAPLPGALLGTLVGVARVGRSSTTG